MENSRNSFPSTSGGHRNSKPNGQRKSPQHRTDGPDKFPHKFFIISVSRGANLPVYHFPNPAIFLEHVQKIFNILEYELIKSQLAYNPSGKLIFKRKFEAAGLLVLAQQIIYTKNVQGISYGDFVETLLESYLPHLRSVRIVAQQYGDYNQNRIGQNGKVPHIEDLVASLVRLACALCPPSDNGMDVASTDKEAKRAASLWWLPMRNYRAHTYVAILNQFRQIIAECCKFFVILDFQNFESQFFSDKKPDWYDFLLRTTNINGLQAATEWLFDANEEPQDAAGWVAHAHHLTTFGLLWPDATENDLNWDINPQRQVFNLTGDWVGMASNLQTSFHLLNRSTGVADFGSVHQISTIKTSEDSTFVLVNAQTSTSPGEASLAVCFPPTSIAITRRTTYVRLVIDTVTVIEGRVAWVAMDAKK